MSTWSGRTALITGGARGQGRSHALALAREGVNIGLIDLAGSSSFDSVPGELSTPDDLAMTAKEVEDAGVQCVAVTADVRDGAAMKDAATTVVDELGGIDYVLANAGIFSWSEVETMSDDVWQDMIDVNLSGIFKTFRAAAPHLKASQHGRAIATASMAGRGGFAQISHYVAAKWGLIGLTKSFALEMIPFGVTANVVAPTNCDTDMINNPAAWSFFAGKEGGTREEAAAACSTMVPMGMPWIGAADVTAAVMFLLSDEAKFMTGEVLHISGGMSATNAV